MRKGFYYDNDLNDDVWLYTAFTEMGAKASARTMRDKFGCQILEMPFLRDDGVWVFMFSNPFKEYGNV